MAMQMPMDDTSTMGMMDMTDDGMMGEGHHHGGHHGNGMNDVTTQGMPHHGGHGGHSTTHHMGGHVIDGTGGGHHGGAKAYFHASASALILFADWSTSSWEAMLGSCIAFFVLAILYEGLKVLREEMLAHDKKKRQEYGTKDNGISLMFRCVHVLQSLLHILQVVISYFLMLVFMTFNIWLCIAVGLGAGVGHFLFCWKRSRIQDPNEHCH